MSYGVPGLEISGTLGQGGFGTVYEADDRDHGRTVALKILSVATDDAARRRFDRERRAMGTLSSHPNIVTVLTSGYTDDERPYLVMEKIDGGSLAERIDAGPMPWSSVEPLALGLSDAVNTAHQAGVIHRDIKPANVLLTSDGQAKLSDFGIAAVASDDSQRVTVSATPAYAAPEILQGRDADEGADLYSLAATLYAALAGRQPYGESGQGMLTVLSQIVDDPVPTLESGVPGHVAAALHRAMAKRPEDRPSSINEFRQMLTGDIPVDLMPPSTEKWPPSTNETGHHRAPATPPPAFSTAEGNGPALGQNEGGPPRAMLAGVVLIVLALAIGGVAFALNGGGTDQTTVPDVQDRPIREAVATLRTEGFTTTVGPICESGVARSTQPAAGEAADTGSEVTLSYDPCITPDFVGMTLDEAIEIAVNTEGVMISWPDFCDDVITGQQPAAGSAIGFDETIELELTPCT